jgi:protein-tyrosine phosphatase
MIDYHCHILPGLDDGANSPADSLNIARELAAVGFTTVYCTPHCMKGAFETRPDQVHDGVAALQADLDREGIALRLEPGMEYCLDEFFGDELERLLPLGTTNMVLLEAPNLAEPQQVRELIFEVNRRRFIPLIAHPERSPVFRIAPESGFLTRLGNRLRGQAVHAAVADSLLSELKGMGCRFQGNLGSFSGFYGSAIKHQAECLKAAAFYDCFGTDAHHSRQLKDLNFMTHVLLGDEG